MNNSPKWLGEDHHSSPNSISQLAKDYSTELWMKLDEMQWKDNPLSFKERGHKPRSIFSKIS